MGYDNNGNIMLFVIKERINYKIKILVMVYEINILIICK